MFLKNFLRSISRFLCFSCLKFYVPPYKSSIFSGETGTHLSDGPKKDRTRKNVRPSVRNHSYIRDRRVEKGTDLENPYELLHPRLPSFHSFSNYSTFDLRALLFLPRPGTKPAGNRFIILRGQRTTAEFHRIFVVMRLVHRTNGGIGTTFLRSSRAANDM